MTVNEDLKLGETVIIPWSLDEVRGTVAEVYGGSRGCRWSWL